MTWMRRPRRSVVLEGIVFAGLADRQQYRPGFGGRGSAEGDFALVDRTDIWPPATRRSWTSWGAWAGTSCWLKTGSKVFPIFTASFFGWRKTSDARSIRQTFYQLFSAARTDDRRHAHQASERVAAVLALLLQCRRSIGGSTPSASIMAEAGFSRGPIELPDGCWIVRCADPQGALFALQGAWESERILRDLSVSEVGLVRQVGWHCFTGQDGDSQDEAL